MTLKPSHIKPFRIVSLVPSQTELLYDLGLENNIVGLTKFCIHPHHLKKSKTIVGGTKDCNFEKIKTLNPTHILCNKEENTKEIVEMCIQITSTHVAEIFSIQDTTSLIETYGNLFDKEAEALKMIQEINFKLKDFELFMKDKSFRKVAYFIWRNPWMAAGNNTYIDHILMLNKFENIYKSKERYPEVIIEKIRLDGDPELVLLSSEPYPFKEKHITELSKYTKQASTILVDGELFSWHGSRLLKAFDYFKSLHNSI